MPRKVMSASGLHRTRAILAVTAKAVSLEEGDILAVEGVSPVLSEDIKQLADKMKKHFLFSGRTCTIF